MSSESPTEWQCTCGTWIPVGYSRHTHFAAKPAAFQDWHAMRIAEEAGLKGVVPDAAETELVATHVLRTKDMPVR